MKKKVSVIMGVYNIEGKSTRGLDSILNQDFSDFEIVIVNDGSTDGTKELLNNYAIADKRVKLYDLSENRGLGGALNHAIKKSDSDILMRMDIDDYAYPNRMSIQYSYLKNNVDIGAVSCYFKRLYDDGQLIDIVELPLKNKDIIRNLSRTRGFCHGGSMIQKECYTKYGHYNSNLKRNEDYDLWLRWRPYIKFANISEVLLDVYRPKYISWEKTRGTTRLEIHKEMRGSLLSNLPSSKTKAHDIYCLLFNEFHGLFFEPTRRIVHRTIDKIWR